MKIHVIDDKEHVAIIREALKKNEGYCPCVKDSKGKMEYLCPCKDFREKTPIKQKCHCGLYIKDEQ